MAPPYANRNIWLAIALAEIAIAIHLTAAWLLRFHFTPDAGVAALMSKHIAEGRAWPIFFYGQSYLGSLEPTIGAMFCKLIGPTGFAVGLGTTFFALLLLPIVFLWAKDAYNRSASWFAAAFCLLGPQGFFHYCHSPRGGYAATLLLNTLCLWLGTRAIIQHRLEHRPNLRLCLGLGFCAGLAWWTNQLVFPALLTIALAALLLLRQKCFAPAWLSAAGAFFIGSAPFWWFNAKHAWASFSFAGSFGKTQLADGIKTLLCRQLPKAFGITAPPFFQKLHYFLLICSICAYICALISLLRQREKPPRQQLLHQLVLLGFFGIFVCIAGASHFMSFSGAAHYLLPLVPAFAVVLGTGLAWLAQYSRPVALGTIVLICGLQASNFSWARAEACRGMQQMQCCRQFCDLALAAGKTNFLADYAYASLNFMSGEKITVATAGQERYHPYAKQIELADDICIIDEFDDPGLFFRRYGGTSQVVKVDGVSVYYDLAAPEQNYTQLPAAEIAQITDAHGNDVTFLAANLDVMEGWRSRDAQGEDWLEIAFTGTPTIRMLRLFTLDRNEYPACWKIEVKDEDDAEWYTLVPWTNFKHFYWSGQRLYWWGDTYRMEIFLPPVKAKKLRIYNRSSDPAWHWTLRLLQVFTLTSPLAASTSDFSALYAKLQERGVTNVYCDRHTANQLWKLSNGKVNVPSDSYAQAFRQLENGRVYADTATAFVIHYTDAELTRRTLDQHRLLDYSETSCFPWIIFKVSNEFPIQPVYGLYWCGFGLLRRGDENLAYGVGLIDLCLAQRNDPSKMARTLRAALDVLAPYGLPPAAAAWCKLSAAEVYSTHNAASIADTCLALRQPAHQTPVAFEYGIVLRGTDAQQLNSQHVQPAELTYYWEIPPALDVQDYVVFVHFIQDDKIIWQDDHPLLVNFPQKIRHHRPDHLASLWTVRKIIPPATVPPGKLQIYCGIYRKSTGRRLTPDTLLLVTKKGVFLPVSVNIKPNTLGEE